MRRELAAAAVVAVMLGTSACVDLNVVSTNAHDTGGGGISAHEGHSARVPGASGTGSSSAAKGQGPVPDSGAPAEPGNAQSPTESNGGTGGASK